MPESVPKPTIYSAFDVAALIVETAATNGHPVSNLSLQKLLFLSQEEHVRLTGRLLFWDDMQAWQYGPVVPAVYHAYAWHGASSIRRACESWSALSMGYERVPVMDLDDDDAALVRDIVSEWDERPRWELVSRVQERSGLWDKTYNPQGSSSEGSGYGAVINFGAQTKPVERLAFVASLGRREGTIAVPPVRRKPTHYEYERVCAMDATGSSVFDGCRELIDRHAEKGDRYEGWLPVKQVGGELRQIDLVFRTATDEAEAMSEE